MTTTGVEPQPYPEVQTQRAVNVLFSSTFIRIGLTHMINLETYFTSAGCSFTGTVLTAFWISVCEQDNPESCGWIFVKFGEYNRRTTEGYGWDYG